MTSGGFILSVPNRNLLTAFHVLWHMNILHMELMSRCGFLIDSNGFILVVSRFKAGGLHTTVSAPGALWVWFSPMTSEFSDVLFPLRDVFRGIPSKLYYDRESTNVHAYSNACKKCIWVSKEQSKSMTEKKYFSKQKQQRKCIQAKNYKTVNRWAIVHFVIERNGTRQIFAKGQNVLNIFFW